MRVTPDRLAVARAVQAEYLRHWVEPENREAAGSLALESVIEPLPESVQGADKLAGNSDVDAAVQREREACADIARTHELTWGRTGYVSIAEQIRARSGAREV